MPSENLLLAGSAGEYREFRPAGMLRPHLRCVWSNTFPRDHGVPIGVVPDGCIDLVWIDGALVVAGPDRSVSVSPRCPGATVVGVRFRPGAAAKWLGLPMSEIVDRRVELRDLWGARAASLMAKIGDARTTAERLRRLEAELCGLVPKVEPPTAAMAFVFNALRAGAGASLGDIRDRLDVSERGLRRRCHDAFGYGPKTLGRILRFQRFLSLAAAGGAPGLAALACRSGYADQAHLTREVRRLSGLAPTSILSQYAG